MRTFIVLGPDRAPVLRTITPSRFRLWVDRHSLGGGAAAAAATFGAGFEVAIPAWDHAALMPIATQYEGPHETRVRGMAASIILGLDPDVELPVLKAVKVNKNPTDGSGARLIAPQPVLPSSGVAA